MAAKRLAGARDDRRLAGFGPMIYHMLPETEWKAVAAGREYAPASLPAEGFIHFSDSPDQLLRVANSFYRGGDAAWVVLAVSENRLRAPLRWEGAGEEQFPHLYGPLNLDSVVAVVPFPRGEHGQFEPPELPR